MKATIDTKAAKNNAENMDGAKERTHSFTLVGFNGEAFAEIACVRVWQSRSRSASVSYSSVWIYGRRGIGPAGAHTTGKGSAGGYGYHKPSAAVGEAMSAAGVRLSGDIEGRGETAIEAALYAIGESLGWDRNRLHVVS